MYLIFHSFPTQLLYKRFHPNNASHCCGSVDESFYFLFSFSQTMQWGIGQGLEASKTPCNNSETPKHHTDLLTKND